MDVDHEGESISAQSISHQQQQQHQQPIEQPQHNEDDSSTLANQMTDAQLASELPEFKPLSAAEIARASASAIDAQGYMRITVPAHRYTPLKTHWLELYQPIVEHMQLQIRFNTRKRCIELRASPHSNRLRRYLQLRFTLLQQFCINLC